MGPSQRFLLSSLLDAEKPIAGLRSHAAKVPEIGRTRL
jgi:hypothetical protein